MSGIHHTLLAGTVGGGGSSSVTLNNSTVSKVGNGDQTSTYRLGNDGIVYHGKNGTFTAQYTWTSAAADDFQARATVDEGGLTSGITGTWTGLGSTLDWEVEDTAADDNAEYAYLTMEIRDASTLEVKATATVDLIANKLV